MNAQAITFDFHNTLAACPEWFDLEVRHLASSFLQWWSAHQGLQVHQSKCDEADARYRQLRREIIDHGNELSAEACLATVLGSMGIEIPESALGTGVEDLMRATLGGASPVPGAIETVRSLHDAGFAIGVVSSAVYHPFLVWTLESFGILDTMSSIITSASAGFYKSRPEIYFHAAEQLGAAPNRMVHVGDSLRFDVGGARRAGMGTVWLQHAETTRGSDSLVPDLTLQTLVQSTPELLRLLASRAKNVPSDNGRAQR